MTSIDEELDLVLQLQTLIHVVAMVLVILAVFVRVSLGGWSVHPLRWRKLIFDLHQYLGLRSIQGRVVMKLRRGEFYRISNLA